MSRPPKQQSDKSHHSQYPAPKEERRIADALNTYTGHYESSEAKTAKHNRKIRRWTRGAAIGAWLYTVITVGILYFSIQGVHEAGRAADAATEQARIAAETEERQLRPYLFVQPGVWSGSIDPNEGGTVTVQPNIVISGQTPAGGINPQWELIVFDFPVSSFAGAPSYVIAHSKSNIVGAPNSQPIPIAGQSLNVTKDDFVKIAGGTKRIYSLGIVMYYDAFAKIRWTNFCFSAGFDQLKKLSAEACPTHNSADWNVITPEHPGYAERPIPLAE